MSGYKQFLSKLYSLATSYDDDDTTKCMDILYHFEEFLDSLLRLENDIVMDEDVMFITNKLSAMEYEKGEILTMISVKYSFFYTQLQFGIPETLIEKYANILYTIRFVYENNFEEVNVYNEMGRCAIDILYMLTNEFFVKDDTPQPCITCISDLMDEMML